MPGFNGTGPQGKGPMTGRGMGRCGQGQGRGQGIGQGQGYGRGMGRFQTNQITQSTQINQSQEQRIIDLENTVAVLRDKLDTLLKLKDKKEKEQ